MSRTWTFEQTPISHVRNGNCPKCSRNAVVSFEDFERRACGIHNSRYKYDKNSFTKLMAYVRIECSDHGWFTQNASNHINVSSGCPKCSNHISKKEIAYLNSLDIPDDPQHRQVYLKNVGIRGLQVDGFDPQTNTVYEFHGDYWHGNPVKYASDDINLKTKKTFGELYSKTMEKQRLLEAAGYRVVTMWESDWDAQSKIL